ncbi:MAG TPA: nitroreductase family deazaflavin-dependent oxidoreductase [Acidimicrobiales bacterium]|nr:nitroreductase family deazaflavin-dependent oxidoreductase [Acidimicrobiales bacterium]
MDAAALDVEPFCYLTTTGRRTGEPHEIEIWFTAVGDSLYLISGGGDRSDWVNNLVAGPAASVRVGDTTFPVTGRVPVHPGEERTTAVERLHAKYADQVSGTLDDWRREAFIVALDTTADLR